MREKKKNGKNRKKIKDRGKEECGNGNKGEEREIKGGCVSDREGGREGRK